MSSDQTADDSDRPSELRTLVRYGLVLGGVLAFIGVAAAQDGCDSITEDIQALQNIMQFLVVIIAAPNGLYGLAEWMTAGDSQERVERGRKRVRNTFIGVAGAAILIGLVNLFKSQLLDGGGGCPGGAMADPVAATAVLTDGLVATAVVAADALVAVA